MTQFDIQRLLEGIEREQKEMRTEILTHLSKITTEFGHHTTEDAVFATDTIAELRAINKFNDNIRWTIKGIVAAVIVGGIGVLFAQFR
jgi:hypothetical protein